MLLYIYIGNAAAAQLVKGAVIISQIKDSKLFTYLLAIIIASVT